MAETTLTLMAPAYWESIVEGWGVSPPSWDMIVSDNVIGLVDWLFGAFMISEGEGILE